MLETNAEQVRALAENSDPIIANPPNTRLLTGPLNPNSSPNFFDLTPNEDVIELASGILRNFPGGLRALDGKDFVRGSGDSELMNGNAGRDTLMGGLDSLVLGVPCGNDTLRGGKDFDVLFGECGNDLLSGNQGDDYAYGGVGDDFTRGGQGNDALVGGSGNDTLIGDAGLDRLWGNEGADLFVLRREEGATSGSFGFDTPRDIGTFVNRVEQVPADFILDYNPTQGDRIGLTGGLTRNDIVLTEKFITIGDARDYDTSGPYPPGSIRTLDFRILDAKATVIREASTGNILGLVKDVSPSQIQFVSVSDGSIALG
ncbi:MAG: calcium-binding protein [Microcoleus sp.]